MKKIILLVFVCIITFAVNAQIKSIDAKFDLRSQTGLGIGATFDIYENIELAPSISHFFPSYGNLFTAEANAHYLLPEYVEKLSLYPLAGIGFFHWGMDNLLGEGDQSLNKLLLNIGFGARYMLNDKWSIFAEEKFQFVNTNNDNYLSIGVNYSFRLGQ